MNYRHLYKYKNAHHIYSDKNGVWHVESFPIVYMNRYYIYFKRPGTVMLDYSSNWNDYFDDKAKDNIERKFQIYFGYKNRHDALDLSFNCGYYLNADASDAKQFCDHMTELRNDPKRIKVLTLAAQEREIAVLQSSYDRYNKVKAEYDKLKAELEESK